MTEPNIIYVQFECGQFPEPVEMNPDTTLSYCDDCVRFGSIRSSEIVASIVVIVVLMVCVCRSMNALAHAMVWCAAAHDSGKTMRFPMKGKHTHTAHPSHKHTLNVCSKLVMQEMARIHKVHASAAATAAAATSHNELTWGKQTGESTAENINIEMWTNWLVWLWITLVGIAYGAIRS